METKARKLCVTEARLEKRVLFCISLYLWNFWLF